MAKMVVRGMTVGLTIFTGRVFVTRKTLLSVLFVSIPDGKTRVTDQYALVFQNPNVNPLKESLVGFV